MSLEIRGRWLITGMVIGGLAVGSLGAARRFEPQNSSRITMTRAASDSGVSAFFLHDSQSNGCWLMVRNSVSEPAAVAPAPPGPCQP